MSWYRLYFAWIRWLKFLCLWLLQCVNAIHSSQEPLAGLLPYSPFLASTASINTHELDHDETYTLNRATPYKVIVKRFAEGQSLVQVGYGFWDDEQVEGGKKQQETRGISERHLSQLADGMQHKRKTVFVNWRSDLKRRRSFNYPSYTS